VPADPGARPASEIHLDPAGPVVAEPQVAGDNTGVSALNVLTGKQAWSFPNDQYCGSTANRVFLIANGQLATLDGASGSQLSYDPNVSDCPTVVDGAILEPSSASQLTVIPQPTSG